jgi:hypothetical protein
MGLMLPPFGIVAVVKMRKLPAEIKSTKKFIEK